MLREHRGDGHIAALMTEGVGGLEAHVLFALDLGMQAENFGRVHHLPAAQLATVVDGMRHRDLVGDDGWLTEQGRVVRQRVEALTDSLAAKPYESLEPDELDELVASSRAARPAATRRPGLVGAAPAVLLATYVGTDRALQASPPRAPRRPSRNAGPGTTLRFPTDPTRLSLNLRTLRGQGSRPGLSRPGTRDRRLRARRLRGLLAQALVNLCAFLWHVAHPGVYGETVMSWNGADLAGGAGVFGPGQLELPDDQCEAAQGSAHGPLAAVEAQQEQCLASQEGLADECGQLLG